LSVQTKNVRIVPETNRANDNAPSHRVFVGRAEIGASWSKRPTEGRDYLSVKLVDPSFNAPIYANLFDDEGGDGHTLIWSCACRQNGDRAGPAASPRPDLRVGLCIPIEPHRGSRDRDAECNRAVSGMFFISDDAGTPGRRGRR
jgi:uncharacterized protein (DUF736 family)